MIALKLSCMARFTALVDFDNCALTTLTTCYAESVPRKETHEWTTCEWNWRISFSLSSPSQVLMGMCRAFDMRWGVCLTPAGVQPQAATV